MRFTINLALYLLGLLSNVSSEQVFDALSEEPIGEATCKSSLEEQD